MPDCVSLRSKILISSRRASVPRRPGVIVASAVLRGTAAELKPLSPCIVPIYSWLKNQCEREKEGPPHPKK